MKRRIGMEKEEIKSALKKRHMIISKSEHTTLNNRHRKLWDIQEDYILQGCILLLGDIESHKNFVSSMRDVILEIARTLISRTEAAIAERLYKHHNYKRASLNETDTYEKTKQWSSKETSIAESCALFLLEIESHERFKPYMKKQVLKILQDLTERTEKAVTTRLYLKGYKCPEHIKKNA